MHVQLTFKEHDQYSQSNGKSTTKLC